MKRYLIGVGVALFGTALLYYVIGSADAGGVTLKPDDAAVVSLGSEVYAQNCASCHGANLEGQPDWKERDADGLLRAPPHDASGHTWHHDSDLLFRLTKYGPANVIGDPSYVTNMPAYEDTLTDDEIIAVLSYIKSTWPRHIRERHDEMEKRQ